MSVVNYIDVSEETHDDISNMQQYIARNGKEHTLYISRWFNTAGGLRYDSQINPPSLYMLLAVSSWWIDAWDGKSSPIPRAFPLEPR